MPFAKGGRDEINPLDVNALHEENIRYAEEALVNLTRGLGVESDVIVGKGSPASV